MALFTVLRNPPRTPDPCATERAIITRSIGYTFRIISHHSENKVLELYELNYMKMYTTWDLSIDRFIQDLLEHYQSSLLLQGKSAL